MSEFVSKPLFAFIVFSLLCPVNAISAHKYNISVQSQGLSNAFTCNPVQIEANQNAVCTLQAVPSGLELARLFDNDNEVKVRNGTYTVNVVNEDHIIRAEFRKRSYKIIASSEGLLDAVSCLPTQLDVGKDAVCTLRPSDDDWELINLTDNNHEILYKKGESKFTIRNVAEDHKIRAVFKPKIRWYPWSSFKEIVDQKAKTPILRRYTWPMIKSELTLLRNETDSGFIRERQYIGELWSDLSMFASEVNSSITEIASLNTIYDQLSDKINYQSERLSHARINKEDKLRSALSLLIHRSCATRNSVDGIPTYAMKKLINNKIETDRDLKTSKIEVFNIITDQAVQTTTKANFSYEVREYDEPHIATYTLPDLQSRIVCITTMHELSPLFDKKIESNDINTIRKDECTGCSITEIKSVDIPIDMITKSVGTIAFGEDLDSETTAAKISNDQQIKSERAAIEAFIVKKKEIDKRSSVLISEAETAYNQSIKDIESQKNTYTKEREKITDKIKTIVQKLQNRNILGCDKDETICANKYITLCDRTECAASLSSNLRDIDTKIITRLKEKKTQINDTRSVMAYKVKTDTVNSEKVTDKEFADMLIHELTAETKLSVIDELRTSMASYAEHDVSIITGDSQQQERGSFYNRPSSEDFDQFAVIGPTLRVDSYDNKKNLYNYAIAIKGKLKKRVCPQSDEPMEYAAAVTYCNREVLKGVSCKIPRLEELKKNVNRLSNRRYWTSDKEGASHIIFIKGEESIREIDSNPLQQSNIRMLTNNTGYLLNDERSLENFVCIEGVANETTN